MSRLLQMSMVLALMAVLLVMAMMSGLIESERWQIKHLDVVAEYERVTAEQIRRVIADTHERSFFRIRVDDIRDSLEALSWVRVARVVKKWPDSLRVTVIEHKAVAVWNSRHLLNQEGEIFEVQSASDMTFLPQLYGADEYAASTLDDFRRFNGLLAPTGVEIMRAEVSNRGSWQLVLRNGLEVVVGSARQDARLVRLADTWSQLIGINGRLPERVDLRYTNGYVANWGGGDEHSTALETEETG